MALRAYQRRCKSLAAGRQTCRALRVADQPIETMLQAARYYGAAALAESAALRDSAAESDRAAAAFVHLAVLQTAAPAGTARLAAIREALALDPSSTRDALWFFGDATVCSQLLHADEPALRHLGVELAGRLTQAQFTDRVNALASDTPETVHLEAAARLGAFGAKAPTQCGDWLARGSIARKLSALEVLCITGTHVESALLASVIEQAHGAAQDTDPAAVVAATAAVDRAFALWAVHAADQALAAASKPAVAPDIALRVVALIGSIRPLLAAWRTIAQQSEPLSTAQRDLIVLVLGKVPAELALRPGAAEQRATALQALVFEVCRHNGCADLKVEQLAGFDDNLLSGPLWPLDQIRLRRGRPWTRAATLEGALDVSHPLRRWLYAEHAAVSGIPFALCIDDLASRQAQALQALEDIRELLGA